MATAASGTLTKFRGDNGFSVSYNSQWKPLDTTKPASNRIELVNIDAKLSVNLFVLKTLVPPLFITLQEAEKQNFSGISSDFVFDPTDDYTTDHGIEGVASTFKFTNRQGSKLAGDLIYLIDGELGYAARIEVIAIDGDLSAGDNALVDALLSTLSFK